jgi:hypothetical protein
MMNDEFGSSDSEVHHSSFIIHRSSFIVRNYSPVIPAKAGIHLGAWIDHHPDGFLLSSERQ